MKKVVVLVAALAMAAGCTTMQVQTTTLPTSGKAIDVLGVAYNNPLTQDLSVITLFDDKGAPIHSASTGGPGIVKSTIAQTTQGTTFGVAFPTKGDNYSGGNAAADGGVATAKQSQQQKQQQQQKQKQEQHQKQKQDQDQKGGGGQKPDHHDHGNHNGWDK